LVFRGWLPAVTPVLRLVAWLLLFVTFFAPSAAYADDLEEVRRGGVLRWGGDQEGGGPYIYPRDDQPSLVTGFEVDLASDLARRIGVRAEFVQGPWDRLPDLLRTRKIHIILNGYELTPSHAATMEAGQPYLGYGLQLLVRRGGNLHSWEDLRTSRAHVGALTGSAAESYLRRFCADRCRVSSYDGSTDSMREVETGKLDATLQDTPIVSFYGPRFPKLIPIGEPVAPGSYVIYARKGQRRLIEALDAALDEARRDGSLERILRAYGLMAERPSPLPSPSSSSPTPVVDRGGPPVPPPSPVTAGERKRGWAVVEAYGGVLLRSAGLTVALSLLSFPLAVGMGLLIALGRRYGPAPLRWVLSAWVELLRGTPLMLQLYFVFFVLPEVGVVLPAFWTGVLGLAVNYSAYEAEIYRAGLQAVPQGQVEAALALGMSRGQAIRWVVLPQAIRAVIPPMVSDFIALFKDTSVCSVITLVELTKRFSVLSQSTQATLELMALTALLYLLMSYPLALLSRRLETRLRPEEQR
ncbi:MAG: ABC transporter substrate-binding protein/permease, partial [Myxococcales bacterium]|nr:ABC transporter substrate-binding protein/permease [Polyangiaceae bacterium]MDW8252078.1 ABC transporter substrate-binding protein/permease [Myxococcales bacterium]